MAKYKYMNIRTIFVSFLILTTLFALPTLLFASDTLTITTYYPSPYGVYNEIRSTRMAIGADYIDNTQYCWTGSCTNALASTTSLVVEGNVGIGTTSPQGALDVVGGSLNIINTGTLTTNVPTLEIQSLGDYWQLYKQAGGANLRLGFDGSDKVTFAYTGNVGIGTTSPKGAAPNSSNGNLDTNDIYLRSTGQWVSQMGFAQNNCYQAIPGHNTRVMCTVGYYVAGIGTANWNDQGGHEVYAICCSS